VIRLLRHHANVDVIVRAGGEQPIHIQSQLLGGGTIVISEMNDHITDEQRARAEHVADRLREGDSDCCCCGIRIWKASSRECGHGLFGCADQLACSNRCREQAKSSVDS
jgi:hypothetical protein